MAYNFVQQAENSSGGSGSSIATSNLGTNPVVGDVYLYVGLYSSGAAVTCTVTDTLSNSFSEKGSLYDSTSTIGMRWGFMQVSTGGSADAFTATFGSSVSFPCVYAGGYHGLALSGAYVTQNGQFQVNPGTAADAVSSGNVTPPNNRGALVFSFSFELTNGSQLAAGTGETARAAVWALGTGQKFALPEDKRTTVNTAIAGTFTSATFGNADKFATCAMVVQEPAGTIERKTLSINGTRTGSRGAQGGMSAFAYNKRSKIFLPARMAA